jgi:hypothetical protein
MEEDVSADPGDIGLFGAAAIVPGADGLADAVEQSRLRCAGLVRFTDASAVSTPSGDTGYKLGWPCRGMTMPMRSRPPVCSWAPNIAERAKGCKANQNPR